MSRDVFQAVPSVLKEAAYGLGCTTYEVVRHVVLPYTRVGVVGGIDPRAQDYIRAASADSVATHRGGDPLADASVL